jgi:hypothetical protein
MHCGPAPPAGYTDGFLHSVQDTLCLVLRAHRCYRRVHLCTFHLLLSPKPFVIAQRRVITMCHDRLKADVSRPLHVAISSKQHYGLSLI